MSGVNTGTCCSTAVVIDQTSSQPATPSLTCYQFMQFGISTSSQLYWLTEAESPGGPRRGGGGGGGGQLPDWDQLQPRPGPDIPDGDDGFFLFSCLICEISGCVVSL